MQNYAEIHASYFINKLVHVQATNNSWNTCWSRVLVYGEATQLESSINHLKYRLARALWKTKYLAPANKASSRISTVWTPINKTIHLSKHFYNFLRPREFG